MQDTIINGVASRLGISHEEFRRTVFAAKKRHQRQQKSESRWSDDGKEAVPNVIEFQDPSSKLLCQMVLIEIKAKTWLAEQISNYKDPQYIPDGDLLAKLANGSYDPTEPSSVGTFLSTLDASVENGLAQLTMKPPAGDHFQAAKDSWRKLTLGVVRRRYHEVEGRLKKRVTDPNAIIELLVELKRLKEMLDRPEDGPDVTSLS